MKDLLKEAGAALALMAFLALALVVILAALAVRIVYETVMLVPRVVRAERGEPVEEQWQHAGPSWPEHLVREDRHPTQADLGTV